MKILCAIPKQENRIEIYPLSTEDYAVAMALWQESDGVRLREENSSEKFFQRFIASCTSAPAKSRNSSGLCTMKDIRDLVIPDPNTRLRYVMDAVSQIRKALDNGLPLIGFAGSPFTLACYMV